MKITIKGCDPLTLSEATIAPEVGKFDATTSYASKLVTRLKQRGYREKKLPLKLECLRRLRNKMVELGSYGSYYEPLAGVGLSARLFGSKGKVWLNDLDEGCQNALKANFPNATVWGGDVKGQAFPSADLIFLDFNDFTFKRWLTTDYHEILDRAFTHAKRFVVLNDCSNFYFRYGDVSFKVYSDLMGSKIQTTEDYLAKAGARYTSKFAKVDWRMIHAAYFRESTFQLYYKGPSRLHVEEVKTGLPVSVSEGFLS